MERVTIATFQGEHELHLPKYAMQLKGYEWAWLMLEYQRLLDSGDMADARVICGDMKWPVHKTILCFRSVWFQKAFTGGSKVGQGRVLS